jgi:hypothetical protein
LSRLLKRRLSRTRRRRLRPPNRPNSLLRRPRVPRNLRKKRRKLAISARLRLSR